MSRRPRIAALLAAVLVTSAAARPALADEEAARQHFRRGVELYDKRRYSEAERAFRDAYREKPSAGIKQNIALSLKAQGKIVEAATAFDEALAEGEGTLKPETRAAIERELAELEKVVATLRLEIVSAATGAPVEDAVVTVDGARLAPGAHRRPVRLPQGIHVIEARAEGFGEPPQKKLALMAGSPVDARFEMPARGVTAGGEGTLTIRPTAAGAVIRIDGVEIARGEWSGRVTAGPHTVEVSAPGYATTTTRIDVPAGATIEVPVALGRPGEAPGVYALPDRTPPPKPKRRYVIVSAAAQSQSLRLSEILGEPPSGTRRSFGGLAVGLRGGYRFTPMFAAELLAEVGGVSARYKLVPSDARDTETRVTHWQLTPVARFTTPGKVRFTAATGFGVHGSSVRSEVVRAGQVQTKRGSGVSASWLLDLGMQFDVGPIFLEAAVFFDVHGVGPTEDDETGRRFFHASPSTRGGVRLGLAVPF